MVANSPRMMTPRDIARILFRHWRKSLAFFCAVMALTLLAIATFPRSYSSEAKLLIRVGRESVALDPTATTGETITLQKSQVDEVNSALNMLNSREVLKQAVEKVGAARICNDMPADDGSEAKGAASWNPIRSVTSTVGGWIGNAMVAMRLSDPATETEQAIRRLEKGIKVSTPKDSTVINLRFNAASPQLAHDVVEAVTNAFLSEHLRLSHSEGSLEFFSAQSEKLHRELTAAQNELRDRMSEFQMTTVGSRRSILEKTEEAMRQKLYELELQENDLKTRYTDQYPVLREVRRQQADTERRLKEIANSRLEMGKSENSKNVQASDSESNAKNELYSELKSVNDQELQISQLKRDVELLEAKYRMHVEKLEQARVNDAMGREAITNVKIAQPASFVQKPVSPNKPLLLALGFLLATFGGIGIGFLSESLDQTLRTTEQVETQLGLPVLLSLPESRRKGRRASASGSAASRINGEIGHEPFLRYRGLVSELLSNGLNGEKSGESHSRTVGVVGCEAAKSRSRIAANLAIQAAASGTHPVLLIDADARHRRVTKRFHINGSPGLREMLSGAANTESCIHRQSVDNLTVMSPGAPNGTNGHQPAGQTGNGTSGQLDGLKTDYRLVVVDLPPASDMDSQAPAAEWLDETVLVVEAERTRIQTALRAKDNLERAGVHVAGVVLANRREYIPRWLYQRL